MSFVDKVAAGLETLGRKANLALDEGKLRVQLLRARRQMDAAARDLGYVTYRQAKGEQPPEGRVEALTRRIAEGEADVARIQGEIDKLKTAGRATEPPAGPEAKSEPAGD